jgi:RNA-directed DNA polymerase
MGATRPPIQLELDLTGEGRGEAPRPCGREVEVAMATAGPESPAWAKRIPQAEFSEGDRLMEAICDGENVEAAVRAVQRNKGAPGVDGMTVRQLPDALARLWPRIARALVEGCYRPQPVKRVRIPKPDGGERDLGIPTVIDRVIQQAILQRLQPLWDPTFSEGSYGFRPGRSAHQAVAAAQAHVAAGREFVVDIDLAKFFDRVNHDRLMAQVAERIADKRVLRLIRAFLTAGALDHGVFEDSREGTPQGGPLSPLLSNLVLDELDRELERRGLVFVRYADDCNIYVASRKAAERVMASVTRFIERRLKLAVNVAKSAADRPWNRTFLGFTLKQGAGFPRVIAAKSVARFKDRVRDLTGRHRGVALKRVIADLNPLLRGWAGYFGFSQGRELEGLDGWIRRRLRCMMWVQWKTRRRRFVELRHGGASEKSTYAAIMSPKGPWRLSASEALHRTLRNRFFKRQGLVFMSELTHA